MPIFDTPEPISVELGLAVGDVQIVASDRTDTVVRVEPSDPSRDQDVQVAQQTKIEYAAGRLVVKAPRQRGLGSLVGKLDKVGAVDVTIELPTGSTVRGDASVTTFRCSGRLGDCRFTTSAGDIELEHTGQVELDTGAGAVVVDHIAGSADVSTGSGRVRLGTIDGTALVKNSNGSNWIGTIGGELRAKTANGDILVDAARAGVTASTANGDLRIGSVARGAVSLKSGFGSIEVGISAGTAARLEVSTGFGSVHNEMNAVDGPESTEDTIEVHARTSYGDITIRRA